MQIWNSFPFIKHFSKVFFRNLHFTNLASSLRSGNIYLQWSQQRWHTTPRTIPWPLMPWLSLALTLIILESVLSTVLSGDRLPTLFSSCFALSVNNNMLMRKRKWRKSINKCFPHSTCTANWVSYIKVTKGGIHSAKLQRKVCKLTISRIFVWNQLVATAKESFERLFEVGIEGDVDDRVDHGMRVGEHVNPKLILFQPEWKL